MVHINWPESHCKEFESIGNRVVEFNRIVADSIVVVMAEYVVSLDAAAVVGGIVVDVVIIIVVVVDEERLGDLDKGDEPVNDWSFFTQNFSQNFLNRPSLNRI